MSDYKDYNKVVQANDLIQLSQWKLNYIPLKIFKTLVSCIDTKQVKLDPLSQYKVTITKKELFSLINTNSLGMYDYLKRHLKELKSKNIIINEPNREIYLSLVNKIIWSKDNDNIEVYFDNDLMPYLIELKSHFLEYDIYNLKNITTKYGLILYEYILSLERQDLYNKYNHTFTISIDELRRITDTQTKYKAFKDFKKAVLDNATNDINNSGVEFLMKYKTNAKQGVKATQVTFKIRKRTNYQEKDFDTIINKEFINLKI